MQIAHSQERDHRAASSLTDADRQIRTASEKDAQCVVAVVVRAFYADPAARWMYPEPSDYRANFPAFVRAFGGPAFASGSAHVFETGSGAALWLGPGVHPDDEAITALIERSLPPERQVSMFQVFEEMARYHPAGPHWHLPLIGVEPAKHRSGLGSVLLRHGLQTCDEQGLSAYLESSTRRTYRCTSVTVLRCSGRYKSARRHRSRRCGAQLEFKPPYTIARNLA